MVAYRGVPQQNVINSIISACELVQKNSPGPECDKEADAVLDSIPDLQKAADDASFIAALRMSNVSTLRKMGKLFAVYATENTDGLGLQTYKDLHAWGLFDGGSVGIARDG